MSGHCPLFIGHRGAKALEAENTLGSFRRALTMGVDMVEFDVHLTRDNVPVVMHDFTVKRTTGGQGSIRKLTLKQFKRLRCVNGETPPTLLQALRLLGKKAGANVEIKSMNSAETVARCFEGKNIRNILFSSFRWKALETVRRILPKARLGVLIDASNMQRQPFEEAVRLGAWSVNPCASLLTPAFMQMAHRQGMKVLVYGLRNPADIKRCFDLKADGLFSDDPKQAMELFKVWKAQARG